MVGDETAERAIVLVVDEADARLAERAGLLGRRMVSFLVVVVVASRVRGGGQLFLGHRRRADLVLVQRDQVANDAVVELERALVLGERGGLGVERRDDVVAGLARADLVGELAAAPVVEL